MIFIVNIIIFCVKKIMVEEVKNVDALSKEAYFINICNWFCKVSIDTKITSNHLFRKTLILMWPIIVQFDKFELL